MSENKYVDKIILSVLKTGETVIPDETDTDVFVHLNDGKKYVATFCTYKKMELLMNDIRSVEERPKNYLWFKNLVLVKEIEEEQIFEVVEEMIDEGDFQVLFKKLN